MQMSWLQEPIQSGGFGEPDESRGFGETGEILPRFFMNLKDCKQISCLRGRDNSGSCGKMADLTTMAKLMKFGITGRFSTKFKKSFKLNYQKGFKETVVRV